jgi:hypothetical protein
VYVRLSIPLDSNPKTRDLAWAVLDRLARDTAHWDLGLLPIAQFFRVTNYLTYILHFRRVRRGWMRPPTYVAKTKKHEIGGARGLRVSRSSRASTRSVHLVY